MKYAKWNKLYINGAWKEGSSQHTYSNLNPFTGETLGEIRLASRTDIDEAYEAARDAQKDWENTPAMAKTAVIEKAIAVLERRAEEIAPISIEEAGSSHFKAHLEVHLTTGFMREAATYPLRMQGEIVPSVIPGKENRIYRLPIGVVGVIAPWNVPLHLGMRSVVSAIATGNTVVLKADMQTYITGGMIIAEAFEEAGLPKGVLNVVVADLAEVGDYFVEHPIPRMISFTGSTAAGRHIGSLAGKHLKKAALELGGNNVFIVLDDADIEKAAAAAVFGKFMHYGQICMCVNRFIVDRKIYPEFVSVFTEKVKALKVGDPADPETVVGPLINRKQVDRILGLIEQSVSEGARVALQGEAQGNLLSPTILIDARNEMAIAQSEIFGPVAVIIPANSQEEAILIANDSEYGLSGAVFSGSLERGIQVAQQIHTGMIHVNDQTINDEPHIAFGGEKGSGLGRFNGEWSLEEFTTVKWISVQHESRAFPF
ncbi:aldehyde dehydrogenase family protein [Effusibacillus dendaii]|uniref:Putative aldehyde dehydrogenase YfmT n=1 Tax=Effusibacillus dendaii TaxID=2743772 RepID=A0A7I8DHX4_9BACL|nr:aldehyde dehydrogenase family protein [Effusibacillus dendaii]BCJ88230.1 putative aldehyde dehydrogenase YfmT [Effusibacillus dendaii]